MTTEVDDVGAHRRAGIADYDVLHEPPRMELVAIVELAARVCSTPMATINLITDVEQHQVATYGFDASVCRREDSMCAAVLHEDSPIVVADASQDDRFRDNPFVTGVIGSVRFYASHQLVTPSGLVIGTLCVFDEEPRTLDETQVHALQTLAERVVDVLELALRGRQLAASNERLTTFAGRVSHDLKSPLASVSMSLGLLRDQLAAGGEASEVEWLLERAIQGSTRMAATIDQVLEHASLGGAMLSEPVRLDRILTEVLVDLGEALDGAAMSLTELPTLVGDEVQLRALLQNLLDNAAKYRHPERPLAIEVASVRRGPTWRISVSDNGRGIAPADRERVFEPRVRIADDVPGSGIGLDTCRRVVQAHGGSIGIAPTRVGTSIWFELPA